MIKKKKIAQPEGEQRKTKDAPEKISIFTFSASDMVHAKFVF